MIDVKSKKDNITVDYLLEICLLSRAVYYSDYIKMKAIEQIEETKVLTDLLKNQRVYERSCFLIKIAEKLSRAKFSTIENSGHEVNINNPKGLAKAMEGLNVV